MKFTASATVLTCLKEITCLLKTFLKPLASLIRSNTVLSLKSLKWSSMSKVISEPWSETYFQKTKNLLSFQRNPSVKEVVSFLLIKSTHFSARIFMAILTSHVLCFQIQTLWRSLSSSGRTETITPVKFKISWRPLLITIMFAMSIKIACRKSMASSRLWSMKLKTLSRAITIVNKERSVTRSLMVFHSIQFKGIKRCFCTCILKIRERWMKKLWMKTLVSYFRVGAFHLRKCWMGSIKFLVSVEHLKTSMHTNKKSWKDTKSRRKHTLLLFMVALEESKNPFSLKKAKEDTIKRLPVQYGKR